MNPKPSRYDERIAMLRRAGLTRRKIAEMMGFSVERVRQREMRYYRKVGALSKEPAPSTTHLWIEAQMLLPVLREILS